METVKVCHTKTTQNQHLKTLVISVSIFPHKTKTKPYKSSYHWKGDVPATPTQ